MIVEPPLHLPMHQLILGTMEDRTHTFIELKGMSNFKVVIL